ncbi:MAG: alanine racemase [Microbacteriaceae bacterium]
MTILPVDGPFREAVIDLGAVRDNVSNLRARVATQYFLAVVKANAYGHGMVPVARAALAGGATHLGVADITEALELRSAGIEAPILTWLHDPNENFIAAVSAGITVCVSTEEQLSAVARAGELAGRAGEPPVVHIKIDTGLSRNGAAESTWADIFGHAASLEKSQRIRVEGVFSHLSNASAADDLAQARRFESGIDRARAVGLNPSIRHLSASHAALTLPDLSYDMVRMGIAIYGISPDDSVAPQEFGLRPVMTLRGRVTAVREVPAGQGVSYDLTYRTEKATRLALVPLGYREGVPRAASDRGPVTLRGTRLRVAGRVAMDQFVVDCGDTQVVIGDEVVLFGDPERGHPTVADWAAATNTIGYEVVTRLGGRLAHTFVDS